MEVAIGRLRRLGGDRLVLRIIDAFLEDGPRRVGAIREGGRAGDLDAVEAAAHSLRSSAGNLGMDALMGLAERIERLGMAGEADPLPPLVEELAVEFERARRDLEARRPECDPR